METLEVLSDALRQKIDDAVNEGEYSEAVRLWAELVRQDPDDERLRVEEIGALCLVHAWQDAEDRAAAAVADFPHSLYVRLAQANIAYLSYNWGVAVDRFEQIRRSFDPLRFHDSLNTVLVQLHCYELMSDYENAHRLAAAFWPLLRKTRFTVQNARRLADAFWPLLRKASFTVQNARRLADAFWPLLRKTRVTFRHESLLLGTLLPPGQRKQHLAWISRALPERFRENFYKRERLASANRAWVRQRAPHVKILSLGQNCLPWMLPNRWGLRPEDIDMNPISPFDYFPSIDDKLVEALDNDFEPFLRESALRPFVTGTKIPALMNDAMQASFFHETGNWWSENNWARLKSAYRERIAKFKNSVRRGHVLYVYAVCGAACVEKVVDSYERVLHDENSRLLIINLLKEPLAVEVNRPHVHAVHIPYPEDYTWTHWEEFTSDRGIAFELEIVGEIIEQIRQLTGDERARPPSDQLSVFDAFRDALSRVAFR